MRFLSNKLCSSSNTSRQSSSPPSSLPSYLLLVLGVSASASAFTTDNVDNAAPQALYPRQQGAPQSFAPHAAWWQSVVPLPAVNDAKAWAERWGGELRGPTREEWSFWNAQMQRNVLTGGGQGLTKSFAANSNNAPNTPNPSNLGDQVLNFLNGTLNNTLPTFNTSAFRSSPTNRYLVQMHYHITPEQLKEHIEWLKQLVLHNNFLGLQKETIDKFAGVLEEFGAGYCKGYVVHLPQWVVDLVKKDPWVREVEEDQTVGHYQTTTTPQTSNNNVTSSMGDTLSSLNTSQTMTQANPPWGLDRITHREPGFKGLYVYPDNAGAGVDIYVLDTGVNVNHVEFSGRAKFGATFSADGNNDGNGHGTHVAGIAAGKTYGVAKGANVIAVKVLDNDGNGLVSTVVQGINWVIRNRNTTRRSVVNMSLGGGSSSQTLNDIVGAATQAGVLFTAAAGNNNTNACTSSPADSGFVMTVGASDENDNKAHFSNFGTCVNIYAPGANITSAYYTSPTDTHMQSGTSQAAPHVAGQMAILLQFFPQATPDEIYATLVQMGTNGTLKGLNPGDNNVLLFGGMNGTALASRARTVGDGTDFG
ncbi:serine protease, partial [Borealophlyctis nickersoniae]